MWRVSPPHWGGVPLFGGWPDQRTVIPTCGYGAVPLLFDGRPAFDSEAPPRSTPALADVTGPAREIDGGTLEVQGQRVRLHV